MNARQRFAWVLMMGGGMMGQPNEQWRSPGSGRR